MDARAVTVGIDFGGTSNNMTVLAHNDTFLIDTMLEVRSWRSDNDLARRPAARIWALGHVECS